MTKYKKNKISASRFDLSLYIVIGLMTIFPLFIRLAGVKVSSDELFYYGVDFYDDSFSYVRGILLAIVVLVAFINLIMNHILDVKKVRLDKVTYLIIGLLFFITLSLLMSEHKITAWRGIMDRFEGYYVNVSYLLLFFICANIKNISSNIRIILKGFLVSSFFVSTIGILQANGINILNSSLLKMLIVPRFLGDVQQDLFMNVADYAYSTLGNPNYVGSYEALTIPIIIGFMSLNDNLKNRIMYGTLLALNVTFLLYSQSEAGLAAVGFTTSLMIAWLLQQEKRFVNILNIFAAFVFAIGFVISTTGLMVFQSRIPVMVFIGCLILGGFISYMYIGKLKKIKYLFIGIISIGVVASLFVFNTQTFTNPKSIIMNELEFARNIKIGMVVENEPVNISLEKIENRILPINNETNVKEEISEDEISYTFSDEKYKIFNYTVKESENGLIVEFDKLKLRFINIEDGFKVVKNTGFVDSYYEKAESITVFKDEYIGSGRGYIWNYSVPLLKSTMFIGVGSDCFIFKFPQYTMINKFNQYNNPYWIIDKPHNIYLQWAVNHGVLSLILLIILIINIVLKLNQFIIKNEKRGLNTQYGYMLFASITSFMIAGIFNDSFIVVSVVFWILLGLGKNLSDQIDT